MPSRGLPSAVISTPASGGAAGDAHLVAEQLAAHPTP
jgi:hypothetical protein